MKTKILILIIVFFMCFSFGSSKAQEGNTGKPKLKIVLVHSYTFDNIGTCPQRTGITHIIKDIDKKYAIDVEDFYMKTKLVNRNISDKNSIANALLWKILKINPDYVFTTDDMAFQYVGIPLANKGFKVFASGLNKNFSEYMHEYTIEKKNIICIEESIKLDPIFNIFKHVAFTPKTFYILYDNTVTSYFMCRDYIKGLTGKYQVVEAQMETVNDLRKFLQKIQVDQPGVIIITLQRLYDPDANNYQGGYIDKNNFFKEFQRINTKHLELCGNIFFSKVGYSLCCGPDFVYMGEILARKFLDVLEKRTNFIHTVIQSDSFVSCNIRRLRELGFKNFADDAFTIIDKNYPSY